MFRTWNTLLRTISRVASRLFWPSWWGICTSNYVRYTKSQKVNRIHVRKKSFYFGKQGGRREELELFIRPIWTVMQSVCSSVYRGKRIKQRYQPVREASFSKLVTLMTVWSASSDGEKNFPWVHSSGTKSSKNEDRPAKNVAREVAPLTLIVCALCPSHART